MNSATKFTCTRTAFESLLKTESTESAITMSTEELWANAWGSGFRVKGSGLTRSRWEFPKTGDPNIAP